MKKKLDEQCKECQELNKDIAPTTEGARNLLFKCADKFRSVRVIAMECQCAGTEESIERTGLKTIQYLVENGYLELQEALMYFNAGDFLNCAKLCEKEE